MPVRTDDGWEILTNNNARNLYEKHFDHNNTNVYVVTPDKTPGDTDIRNKKYYFVAKLQLTPTTNFKIIIHNEYIDSHLPNNTQLTKLRKILDSTTSENWKEYPYGTLHKRPDITFGLHNAYANGEARPPIQSLPWETIDQNNVSQKYLPILTDENALFYVYDNDQNQKHNLYILATCSEPYALLISGELTETTNIKSQYQGPEPTFYSYGPLTEAYAQRVRAAYNTTTETPNTNQSSSSSNSKEPTKSLTLSDKLEQIEANKTDKEDTKSNTKENQTDGRATKYAKAMKDVAGEIQKITDTINKKITAPKKDQHEITENIPVQINVETVEQIYDTLANQLNQEGFHIKGFNTKNNSVDPIFQKSKLKTNPNKLNIVAFKAKNLEFSDTNRYTQEFIGILAKYINTIVGIIRRSQEYTEKPTKTYGQPKKFKDDLKDADAYALKFVNSIKKIKNRKGHRAAITFPCAFNAIKDVLTNISTLCETLISHAN